MFPTNEIANARRRGSAANSSARSAQERLDFAIRKSPATGTHNERKSFWRILRLYTMQHRLIEEQEDDLDGSLTNVNDRRGLSCEKPVKLRRKRSWAASHAGRPPCR